MRTVEFDKVLAELSQRGGQYQWAADQVFKLLGKVSVDVGDPFKALKLTKHGESRIAKCRKYDLEIKGRYPLNGS